ncbi:tyrosine-type recombinase/integrase [Neobacillus terrae]|uniref:tyrosine-type recombinase/integrase n=1 Tax=Neobacillus terrae TaxID=3034837 RepID=UPI00140A34EA|nr:tyrosine-type recombinase/integrase [Neobacillus terrae]
MCLSTILHNLFIFVTEHHPHRMSIAQLRNFIKQISKRTGINKKIHPHQLRHSTQPIVTRLVEGRKWSIGVVKATMKNVA